MQSKTEAASTSKHAEEWCQPVTHLTANPQAFQVKKRGSEIWVIVESAVHASLCTTLTGSGLPMAEQVYAYLRKCTRRVDRKWFAMDESLQTDSAPTLTDPFERPSELLPSYLQAPLAQQIARISAISP
jgi:hypothetical protein